MKVEVVVADICGMEVDVIVNAANPALIRGGGVCGAIHAAAGIALEETCLSEYPMGIHTGEAVHTDACALPAKWVIHTTGPKYDRTDLLTGEALLSRCYKNSLSLAAKLGATSIAFPAISTGIYGFAMSYASEIAVNAIHEWAAANPATTLEFIYLVAFDSEAASFLRNETIYWLPADVEVSN